MHTHIHIYIYNFLRSLKFTLKHLKRSYMFRSYDHPQEAYFVPCYSYSLKHSVIYFVILIWCCGSMSCVMCESYGVENGPGYGCASYAVQREDDRVIETCRSVLNVLM